MNLTLAFDKTGTEVSLPTGFPLTVLEPRFAEELPSADDALAGALRSPIGSPPLAELARGKSSAA